MRSVMNSMWLFVVLLVKRFNANKIHWFTLKCIQSGEKCSFISLLAPYPFNKYTFLIKILSSSVKVILFIFITTIVCQGAWLPWKPCSWYSTHTKLNDDSLCEKSLWANVFWWIYADLPKGCRHSVVGTYTKFRNNTEFNIHDLAESTATSNCVRLALISVTLQTPCWDSQPMKNAAWDFGSTSHEYL